MYFPQHNYHDKTVTMKEIEALLLREGLIPEGSYLERTQLSCYCYGEGAEDCTCLPDGMVYSWYTPKPNLCDTCGAVGSNPCQTRSGRRTKYHKNRKLVEQVEQGQQVENGESRS
jgi:hypothetical protein